MALPGFLCWIQLFEISCFQMCFSSFVFKQMLSRNVFKHLSNKSMVNTTCLENTFSCCYCVLNKCFQTRVSKTTHQNVFSNNVFQTFVFKQLFQTFFFFYCVCFNTFFQTHSCVWFHLCFILFNMFFNLFFKCRVQTDINTCCSFLFFKHLFLNSVFNCLFINSCFNLLFKVPKQLFVFVVHSCFSRQNLNVFVSNIAFNN